MWFYFLVLLLDIVCSQHGEYIIGVEHKIGDGEWIQRATLILSSIKQSSVPSHNIPQYIPIPANEQINELKNVGSSNDTLYYIRVPHKAMEEGEVSKESTKFVSVVARACSIVEADLTHSLNLHMDGTGYVTGLSLHSSVEECLGRRSVASSFNTQATVSFPIVGASPDVHTFIQMKEKEDKKKTGEGTDKRSFLAKYWMYILPVALLLMMSMGQ